MNTIKTLIALTIVIPMLSIHNPSVLFAQVQSAGLKHPEWSKNAVIYEVNIRQYTHEGTFAAFMPHLDRLHDMGVDILWLMPINPIGKVNRKGSLGSYYSIADYTAVNPEFGTLEDLKQLVARAHTLGMHVIIDWVANHSSWDNPWTLSHPAWYKHDKKGNFVSPFDWTDVLALDYENPELRKEMIKSMEYWIKEADIDGFRCDVAMLVPTDFWDVARKELDAIKPVFMLAEAEEPLHHKNAFDMSYSWDLFHLWNDIAQGKKTAADIDSLYKEKESKFSPSDYRMLFTSNHDENSWNGTEYERMGDGALTFAVLATTMPGMLLIYSGQEDAWKKRLKFFDKDEIIWDNISLQPFYQRLITLKTDNQALWNGAFGGDLTFIGNPDHKEVLGFARTKENNSVIVIANLSNKPSNFMLDISPFRGIYMNYVTGNDVSLAGLETFSLDPWGYLIFVK